MRREKCVPTAPGNIAQAVPGGSARTRDGAPFGPGLPMSPQAGPLDQILALLGRSPAWPG